MKQKKNGFGAFFLGCVAIQALSGCADATTNEKVVTQSVSTQADDAVVEISKNDNLAIDAKKCIGCGKCARTAPKNFVMNNDTRKAEVSSHEIASQTAIDRAVSNCPTKAIIQ